MGCLELTCSAPKNVLMKTRLNIPTSRFLLPSFIAIICFIEVAAAQQIWQPTRNNAGNTVINFNGSNEVFTSERSNQQILTNFPIGHNLRDVNNHLFYNLDLDGYGGLPLGSCLQRGYLIPNSNPNKELCTANENRDLMRVWANQNINLKNVVLKNMSIKNAFRTYNLVDGVVVETFTQLPHTDTFQTFYSPVSTENPDWLVIQDTEIMNSDNNLMISGGGRFNGVLYHNLRTSCDSAFVNDVRSRIENDFDHFRPNDEYPTGRGCANSMRIGNNTPALVWLVSVDPNTNGIHVTNDNDRVIIVGHPQGMFRIISRDANRAVVDHPNVHYYDNIEAALAAESRRPPMLELSCAGWVNPPANCESRIGFVGGSAPSINTTLESNDDDNTGSPDGSDNPDTDTNTPAEPPTNARPIAHWALDETNGTIATDSSGSIDGNLVQMASNQWNRNDAKIGNSSLRFDGNNERVSLSNINLSGNRVSFMGWIKPSNIASNNGEGRILSKATSNQNDDHIWMLSTDQNGSGLIVPRVRLNIGGNTTTLLGNNASEIANDQWVHIAATYNGEQLRLYRNGVLVGSTALQGTVSTSSAPAAIGNQPQGGRGFEGLIDDVCLFNDAITTEEIRYLYNDGNGRACNQVVNFVTNTDSGTTPVSDDNGRQDFFLSPILHLLIGGSD